MQAIVNVVGSVFNWIVGLGTGPMLSFMILLVGLVFRIPAKKNLRGALMMGIGITGIMMVINSVLLPFMTPTVTEMSAKLGLSLEVVDIGWAASGLSFIWPGAFIVVGGFLLLDFILIILGVTRVLWIDIWNFWNANVWGCVAFVVTKNLWLAVGLTFAYLLTDLFFADWSANAMQEYFEMPGCCWDVASCHLYQILAGPFNWIFDKIPGINKINWSSEKIEEKLGYFGQSVIMGFGIGFILGLLGGTGGVAAYIANAVKGGAAMSATMVILPKMVGLLMEGIMPITSSIREFMMKRFKGKEILITLDHATLMGHPSVIAASLICMPLVVILSAVLPGSGIVATASVAAVPWWVSSFAAKTKGNVFRMVIMMLVWMIPAILIATWAAPGLTAACAEYGIAAEAIAEGQIVGTLTPSDPLTGLMYWVATMFAA